MSPGEAHLMVAQKYLNLVMTIEITGNPLFVPEFLLIIFVFAVYVYLCFEAKRLPFAIQTPKKSVTATPKTTNHGHKEKKPKTQSNFEKGDGHNSRIKNMGNNPRGNQCHRRRSRSLLVSHRITALTPTQFVRLDKRHQLCNMQTSACIHSLKKFIKKIARSSSSDKDREPESTQKQTSHDDNFASDPLEFMESERVTESLVGILNEIIDDTAVENSELHNVDLKSFVEKMKNCELPLLNRSRSDTSLSYGRNILRFPN